MDEEIIQQSIELAARWQRRSNAAKSSEEAAFDQKIARMVENPSNKVFLTELIDQSFRPLSPKRVADQIAYLLRSHPGIDLFNQREEFLIQLFLKAGIHVPAIAVPAIIRRIRNETVRVILNGESKPLEAHLINRKKEGFHNNVNIIGEALHGEKEAESRMRIYEAALAQPTINYISIKISTIYSQIEPLAFEATLDELAPRLERLFRCARENGIPQPDGKNAPKFVNLDMEEYNDLALTVEAFKRTLDREEFLNQPAGIVLQAYLPDSFAFLEDLVQWGQSRVANGGAPIKLRIVKGANMDMEQTEAALRAWPQAPYRDKLDTDANYKRMLDYLFKPERASCVNLGIASHNLLELAHAHLLAKRRKVTEHIVFEMLEGMAGAASRTLLEEGIPVLLYAPVATPANFTHAIAYYVRRLDENTSPQNFLTYAFALEPGNQHWSFLADQFRASFDRMESAPREPFRTQNRLLEAGYVSHSTYGNDRFCSEPDTDWTIAANREWAQGIIEKWRAKKDSPVMNIPVCVGEQQFFEGLETKTVVDASQHEQNLPIARYALATRELIDQALEIAHGDESGWGKMTGEKRHRILGKAAQQLRKARGDLIGVAAAEVGKVFSETDAEVSEAIDFCEFYPFATNRIAARRNLRLLGKGAGVVVPPWNFPVAIPAGGVFASLAAGNSTLLKPSPQATYCSWIICHALWKAGVPKTALQFLPCRNEPEASYLTEHPKTSFVIFTGSTQTALGMLKRRPELSLHAETGGKNAMIVSAVSDRDQAIADVMQSAFGNTGQKCSATSLLILHRSLYEDTRFKAALVDAAQSLPTGYAWDLKTKLGPLANPVSGPLEQALESFDHGEEWALEPELSRANPHRISPGILWNVTQDSYSYRNELFGPVLGVMVYDTLDEAIRLVNETDYGLTSGIHTLDEREIAKWRDSIRAGNLYINRGTTGAIVMRQPFGGMARSAIGPGIKVGYWNYPLEFLKAEEIGLPQNRVGNHPLLDAFDPLIDSFPEDIELDTDKRLRAAFESALFEYENVFSKTEDYFRVRGERNQSRYLPLREIMVRIEPQDSAFSIFSRLFNVRLSGARLIVSAAPEVSQSLRSWLRLHAPQIRGAYREETQSSLCDAIESIERIRFASPVSVTSELRRKAASKGIYIADAFPLVDGRLELLLYFREQCISYRYHRYGNLGRHNPSMKK